MTSDLKQHPQVFRALPDRKRLEIVRLHSLNCKTIDAMRDIFSFVATGTEHKESCRCSSLRCPPDADSTLEERLEG